MYHPFYSKDIGWKFESNTIFLKRSIKYIDPLHRNSARQKTNSISDITIQQFLITRTISLKIELNSASGEKKQLKKTKQKNSPHGKYYCHVDKFGSNDDLDTFIWWYK